MKWRIGTKVPVNVYEGDRPVCQCHTSADARLIAAAPELLASLKEAVKECRCSLRERDSGHNVECFVPVISKAEDPHNA